MNKLQFEREGDMEQDELLRQLGGTADQPTEQPELGRMDAPGMFAPDEPVVPGPAESPAYAAKGPAMGLEGFDQGKLSSGHLSPKYVFAKHAQGLGVNDRDELMRRLQGDESGYFKNASWGGSKGDILNVGGQLDPKFEGMSQFDVIRAMGEGGKGWQWGGVGDSGPAPAPQGQPQGAGGMTGLVPTDMGTYNTLQAKIAEILGGPEAFSQEALMKQLGVR